ncbi:MAG: YceK/YidQ family lipoprotein [Akkermansiaceae bacterium]|nr:YceK/YidQ family lipoprotein [Akkermansiaceae bacterium]
MLFRCLSLFALCLLLGGCATSFVRSDINSSSTELYPATRFNAEAIVETGMKGEPLFVMEDPDYREPTSTRVLTTVVSLIDLPFSLVTDTLFLPWDWKSRKGDDSEL